MSGGEFGYLTKRHLILSADDQKNQEIMNGIGVKKIYTRDKGKLSSHSC
jgi:hypothetical protein